MTTNTNTTATDLNGLYAIAGPNYARDYARFGAGFTIIYSPIGGGEDVEMLPALAARFAPGVGVTGTTPTSMIARLEAGVVVEIVEDARRGTALFKEMERAEVRASREAAERKEAAYTAAWAAAGSVPPYVHAPDAVGPVWARIPEDAPREAQEAWEVFMSLPGTARRPTLAAVYAARLEAAQG